MIMSRIYPKSVTFTPTNGTAVTLTTFQDAAEFNFTNTYNDSISQSDLMAVGKYITGTNASISISAKFVTTQQYAALIGAGYDTATETVKGKLSWDSNYGTLTLIGYDTEAKREVAIKFEKTLPVVSGNISLAKDSEVVITVDFTAIDPKNGADPFTFGPAPVTAPK